MRLWRISRYPSIDGAGGLLVAGRWHSVGRRVTYCSLHPATALLEWLVHLELDVEAVPASIPYTVIEVPPEVSTQRAGRLPENWRENTEATRSIGDRWLREGKSAILIVPSAIVGDAENALLNPDQKDFGAIRVLERKTEGFDLRLLNRP